MVKMGKVFLPVVFFVLLISLITGIAIKETWAYNNCRYYYEALIDADNNEATGGDVQVVQQGETKILHGIDYKVRIDLDFNSSPALLQGTTRAPAVLHNLQIWKWRIPFEVSGSEVRVNPVPEFVVISTYDIPIPLGIENGVSSGDVIEFFAPKADLINLQKPSKVVFHASTYTVPESDFTSPILFGGIASVPTLTQWGMIILSGFLLIIALWMVHRQKTAAGVLFIVLCLVSISGTAWAPPSVGKITPDGEINDWNAASNVRVVYDRASDSSSGDPGEDIRAGFMTEDEVVVSGGQTFPGVANNLYFRIDVTGGAFPVCLQP
jgi:hypothetical protein